MLSVKKIATLFLFVVATTTTMAAAHVDHEEQQHQARQQPAPFTGLRGTGTGTAMVHKNNERALSHRELTFGLEIIDLFISLICNSPFAFVFGDLCEPAVEPTPGPEPTPAQEPPAEPEPCSRWLVAHSSRILSTAVEWIGERLDLLV